MAKDIPRLAEIPADTPIVNANAQSWDDLVADAKNYPNPAERMSVIVGNQLNAVASALCLLRASRPLSDVRIPYVQLSEAEKAKDRHIRQAVRDALKSPSL